MDARGPSTSNYITGDVPREKDTFLTIQHNLQKLGWPNKVGEFISAFLIEKLQPQNFLSKSMQFSLKNIKNVNRRKQNKSIFLSAGFIMNINQTCDTQKFS